jgi:hypothetical protein
MNRFFHVTHETVSKYSKKLYLYLQRVKLKYIDFPENPKTKFTVNYSMIHLKTPIKKVNTWPQGGHWEERKLLLWSIFRHEVAPL